MMRVDHYTTDELRATLDEIATVRRSGPTAQETRLADDLEAQIKAELTKRRYGITEPAQ